MTVLVPQWLQNKGYPAYRDNNFLEDLFSEGVMGSEAFKVEGGSGMSVNVKAGVAYITGDNHSTQGRYRVENDAQVNLTIASVTGGNRTDAIVLEVRDAAAPFNVAGDDARLRVVQGVVGGAGGAVPTTAIGLANVTVHPGDTSSAQFTIADTRTQCAVAPNAVPADPGQSVSQTAAHVGSVTYSGGETGASQNGLVSYNALQINNGNMWDSPNSRFIIQRAGNYLISGWVAGPGHNRIGIRKNGAVFLQSGATDNTSSEAISLTLALVVNDYIQLYHGGWDGSQARGYTAAALSVIELIPNITTVT